MASIKASLPPKCPTTGTFRVLARFVDELLPTLKDTELRLALIVLRQTWGYGKEADWLSHSQLKQKTGRASEAVSAAIDALVRRGLIEVVNVHNVILSDPAERRREHGRLLYRPGPVLHREINGAAGGATGVSGKAKTTDIPEEQCRFRKTVPISDIATPERQARIEVQKRRIRERLASL